MKRVKALYLTILLISVYFSSTPLALADYTVAWASFPPDLPGDISNDGKVGLGDFVQLAKAYGASFGRCGWNPFCDLNDDGEINLKDLIELAKFYGRQYSTSKFPVAWSKWFEFEVPNDGDTAVWYYILVHFYVSNELNGKTFSLAAGKSVDDAIRNVKVDCLLRQSDQVGGFFNINLGELQSGYHLLELEYLESTGGGLINFTIKTANDEYAWMDRFRIYVPNCSDTEVKYTVKTTTYFPYDQYFLVGYADDYIKSIWIDASEIWHDWEWDMGPNYGALYAGEGGFCYPLGYRENWRGVKFTFGEIWFGGLLDFKYVSRSNQPAKIGDPRFWTSIRTSEASSYLKIYQSKVWIGSKWLGDVATSSYMIATTVRVLVNATGDNPYYLSIPQEAQVSLILYPLLLQWPKPISHVDIGVIINLTYTYYVKDSLIYGMPIWFEPYSIEVKTPEQGSVLYIPQTSMVFCTQSDTSFISPEWKIYLKGASSILVGCFVGYVGWYLSGSWWGSTIAGGASGGLSWLFQDFFFKNEQKLNLTQEYTGTPSYRKFSMNAFKTTEQQLPLSPVVSNQSSVFFFRVYTCSSFHCGSVSIAMKGRLWLPFSYREPGHGPPGSPNWYGDWLPTNIEIETRFPVFVEG